MTLWTSDDIPRLDGRLAIVTGTGGLGFQTAQALARAGADVILAGRNEQSGQSAIAEIKREMAHASVRFSRLDLARLASIAAFAERMRSEHDRIDLLINNAAVMTPPRRLTTSDGFELQFGTNYLGHFALTAQMLPLLRKGRDARIVTVSSVAARGADIDFSDLQAELAYRPSVSYGQSKLAQLAFALELQRRSDAAGWNITSVAAHPGISRTDLLHKGPGRWSGPGLARSLLPFLFQPAAQGALPTLFAATSPEAKGGGYYGPDKLLETRGHPKSAKIPERAFDRDAATELWIRSEHLIGMSFAPVNDLPVALRRVG